MAIDAGVLDQVTQEFLTNFQHQSTLIGEAAKQIFYYLVTIQLALTAIWMTVAGESLQRFTVRMLQLLMSFGFFYYLIQMGGHWIPDFINGFIDIGRGQGVTSLDPSSVFTQGVSISNGIFKGFFNWGLLTHPFVSILAAVICVTILFMYAFIAADLTVVLVKAYVVVTVGGIFFAFGTNDFTRTMMVRYFSSVIGLGLQLMTLYMLLGVGQHLGSDWAAKTAAAAQQHELIPMFVVLGAVIVYFLLIKNVPPFIAGLSGVGGFRNYGDAAVAMATNTATSGVSAMLQAKMAAAKSVQAGAQAVTGGGHLASSIKQGWNNAKADGSSFGGKLRGAAKSAGGSLASATANTVKDMATKQHGNMSVGQKMNHHMANKVAAKHAATGEKIQAAMDAKKAQASEAAKLATHNQFFTDGGK